MRFYEMKHNSSFERKWTMAVSIHASSHVIQWSCPDCGRAAKYPAGSFDVTIEGGQQYPDILGCGAYPLLIVSENVLCSWQEHDIGPIVTYPVSVAKALDTTLSPQQAPHYYRVEVVGEAKVDIPASGGKITQMCFRCGGFRTEPMVIRKMALLPGSWDGNPVFRDHRLFPAVVFCEDSVRALAKTKKHTNFSFREMG